MKETNEPRLTVAEQGHHRPIPAPMQNMKDLADGFIAKAGSFVDRMKERS